MALKVQVRDKTPGGGEAKIIVIDGTLTKGDIIYVDADGNLAILPIGTTGQVLKVSSGGLPVWGTDAT